MTKRYNSVVSLRTGGVSAHDWRDAPAHADDKDARRHGVQGAAMAHFELAMLERNCWVLRAENGLQGRTYFEHGGEGRDVGRLVEREEAF